MVSIDSSLGIQIVNFLVLIYLLHLLLYRPILGVMAKRKRQLEASEAEVQRLRENVDEKMAAYEAKLLQAKNEAMAQKQQIVAEGEAAAAAAMAAVRGELPDLMAGFQARMARETETAKGILTDRSRQLSREIAEKILGRSLP